MGYIKGEHRIYKQRRSSKLCRIAHLRCGRSILLCSAAFVFCTSLYSLYFAVAGAVASLHQADLIDSGPPRLSHQEIYDEYRKKRANLKIKLLSEEDGAPFLQSRKPPRPREITIVTQATTDRWPQLEKMATSWGGALCVAVYVKTGAEIVSARTKMMWLHDRIEAQGNCRLYLQMVMEEGFRTTNDALSASYPINALRNVALGIAQTELVFLLDADFEPSPGLHEKLTRSEKVYADLTARTSKGQLLVVPAFQVQPVIPQGVYPGAVSPLEEPIPQSMQEVRERWDNGSITSFHSYYPPAHNSTSYSHFLHPLTTEPYHVQYKEYYEPYFIAARALIPKFDERFRGYGKNKISHAYDCAARGFTFVVLPGVYVWEIPHPKTEFHRKFMEEQRESGHISIMHVVYNVFKDELQAKIKQPFTSLNLTDSKFTTLEKSFHNFSYTM